MRKHCWTLLLGATLALLPACGGEDIDPDEASDAVPEGVSVEPIDEYPATGGVSLEGNVTPDSAAPLEGAAAPGTPIDSAVRVQEPR